MVPSRNRSAGIKHAERALARLRCAGTNAMRPLLEKLVPRGPRSPAAPRSASRLLCGACRRQLADLGVGRSTRCPHCGHTLSVPSHIRAECPRCGDSSRVRTRERGAPRLCKSCGQPLEIADITLAPKSRHHRHHTSRHHRHDAPADAAWAVLIVGLTLVIVVLALTCL